MVRGLLSPLNLATQEKTEEEVKENMKDLIDEHMRGPDTPKPEIKAAISASVITTTIPRSGW